MSIYTFINEYQTLIGTLLGAFLAIISSILLWSIKEWYEKKKKIKNSKKEIEDMFFMMARDTEESVKDLANYISHARQKFLKDKKEFHIFQHSKFNKVYINEERLFMLKQDLDFILSQQIDIAVSSAKKFNSYMESIEIEPAFIFDGTVKTIQTGIETKEEAIADYKKSINAFLNKIDFMLKNDLRMSQINILRPVVALSPKYKKLHRNIPTTIIDEMLEEEAKFVLVALKKDLT